MLCGTLLYFYHVVNVVMEVTAALARHDDITTNQQDLAIQASPLQDILEDTPIQFEDVENLFGQQVAQVVNALNKNLALPASKARMKDSLWCILPRLRVLDGRSLMEYCCLRH